MPGGVKATGPPGVGFAAGLDPACLTGSPPDAAGSPRQRRYRSLLARKPPAIKQRADGDCGAHADDWFLAVAIVNRSEGDHVVVAMGSQGALHRSPEGRWTRVGVLDRQPAPLHGPSWLRDLSLTPLAAAALSPVVFMVGWRRRSKARGLTAFAVALAGSVALLSLSGALLFFGVDYVVAGPVIAALSVVVFIASVVFAVTGKPERTAV